MLIKDGLLDGVPYRKARWIGGAIVPEIVIVHDTASGLGRGDAAEYLRDNDRKVSVHFVIERDGSIEQQVPVTRRANHAGRSNFHGRENCNGFALGIELVNPGRMTRYSAAEAMDWRGKRYAIADFGIQEITTPQHGHGLWMPHSPEQIASVLGLLTDLFDAIPELKDVTTHWYVSPGRKVDPGPTFPLDQVRSVLFGREDPSEEDAWDAAGADDGFVQVNTPADSLNMRRWPSFNPNILAAIPHRTVVPVLRTGTFGGRLWHLVQYGGHEGWVVAAYTDRLAQQGAPA